MYSGFHINIHGSTHILHVHTYKRHFNDCFDEHQVFDGRLGEQI